MCMDYTYKPNLKHKIHNVTSGTNVVLCCYKINSTGRMPFLQYLLENVNETLDFHTVPLFTGINPRKPPRPKGEFGSCFAETFSKGWVEQKQIKGVLAPMMEKNANMKNKEKSSLNKDNEQKLLEQKKLAKLTILPRLGCEGIADALYKYVNGVYIPDNWGPGEAERLWCFRVEVRETISNMAYREGHREWNEDLFS